MSEKQDWGLVFRAMAEQVAQFQRVLDSTTGVQREYLLPEAQLVKPVDTPLYNRMLRKRGAGKAASWKEITAFTSGGSVFYAETGKPNTTVTAYAARSAAYCLVGRDFGVTGFQRAAGATFADSLVSERANALIALKELEEDAIINADSGADPLAFDGLIVQIAAANGSYVDNIGGALALPDLDAALRECQDRGYQISYMIMNTAEIEALNTLAKNAGLHQVVVSSVEQQGAVAGSLRVKYYLDPITGYPVEIVKSRYLAAGTILGIPERLPAPVPGQGQDGIWLDVLQEYTEVEIGKTGDTDEYFIKAYEALVFPGRRGAFKLTGIA